MPSTKALWTGLPGAMPVPFVRVACLTRTTAWLGSSVTLSLTITWDLPRRAPSGPGSSGPHRGHRRCHSHRKLDRSTPRRRRALASADSDRPPRHQTVMRAGSAFSQKVPQHRTDDLLPPEAAAQHIISLETTPVITQRTFKCEADHKQGPRPAKDIIHGQQMLWIGWIEPNAEQCHKMHHWII